LKTMVVSPSDALKRIKTPTIANNEMPIKIYGSK